MLAFIELAEGGADGVMFTGWRLALCAVVGTQNITAAVDLGK